MERMTVSRLLTSGQELAALQLEGEVCVVFYCSSRNFRVCVSIRGSGSRTGNTQHRTLIYIWR